jgi:hypothetical protein
MDIYIDWGLLVPGVIDAKNAFEWPHVFFVTEAQAILLDLGTWALLKPGDFADILNNKVLHFVQSVGLLNLWQRVAQKIRNSLGARINVVPAL